MCAYNIPKEAPGGLTNDVVTVVQLVVNCCCKIVAFATNLGMPEGGTIHPPTVSVRVDAALAEARADTLIERVSPGTP